MVESDIVLQLKNLKKHFPIKKGFFQRTVGHVRAVDGIDLSVREGETLSIVGESGSGKTTAGRTIIRLYQPTAGKIIYRGQDISHLSEKDLRKTVRKEIQMIFQDPYASLNPYKTVGNTLMEPLKTFNLFKSHTERLNKIKELLEVVGLDPSYSEHYPHEFSGGQRQRIGIARTLALNPRLIIADEPVSALDVSIQAQIINLLIDLQEQFKLTYVFISHDLSVVRHISDRIAVMYLGKIVEVSEKFEFFSGPKHPYSKALLSAVPIIKNEERPKIEKIELQGEIPDPSTARKGCVFSTRCPFVMEKCKTVEPQLKEVGEKQVVACHLYE